MFHRKGMFKNMPIIVSNIKLPISENQEVAFKKATQAAGLTKQQIKEINLHKLSIDARKRDNIQFVYTVRIDVFGDGQAIAEKAKNPDVKFAMEEKIEFIVGEKPLSSPPVIVGFGPAGMFAALVLAKMGYCPIVLERGSDVDNRVQKVERFWKDGVLDTNTCVQFGEGGAGTFSDGKLTTRISDDRCGYVLQQLVEYGAPREILFKQKPHIGTDNLRKVVKKIREDIIANGGKVMFDTPLKDIVFTDNKLSAVVTENGEIQTGTLILAIGHSARDTFEMLMQRGIFFEPKSFSVGARIEHLQSDIDKGLYGNMAGDKALPIGEYQLSHRENDRGVYTFCMCPGGVVVPAASEEGMVVTNGMSEYARKSGIANTALVVSVTQQDYGNHPIKAIEFQRTLEKAAYKAGGGNYKAPIQTVGNFLSGKPGAALDRIQPSYAIGCTEADLTTVLPPFVTDMMKIGLHNFARKLKGYDAADAVLTGIESRTSSPVRITRGENMQSISMEGLYPCGEGAGYAGGIISAAVDGIRIAQAIMAQYKPMI
ncbi:MAG: hypothetical protein RR263_00540 [Oscillospiraceae bacterium]